MDKEAISRVGKELVKRMYGTTTKKVSRSDFAVGEYRKVIEKYKSWHRPLNQERAKGSIAKSYRVQEASKRSAKSALKARRGKEEMAGLEYAALKPKMKGIKNPRFSATPLPSAPISAPETLDKQIYKYLKTAGKNTTYGDYKKHKVVLTPEERAMVMKRKAVWHHGPKGEATPAVWKSVNKKTGKTTYITNTHRAMNTSHSLLGAIDRYHKFIKSTA